MLHITNGDSANVYLKRIGILGQFQAWQDALHEGHISTHTELAAISNTRSYFLAEYFCIDLKTVQAKFSKRDEVLTDWPSNEPMTLWLTPELFDALIGLQFLAWYRDSGRAIEQLNIVMLPEYLPPQDLTAAEVINHYQRRFSPSAAFFQLAEQVWLGLVTSLDMLERTLALDFKYWPNLKPAMLRYLEEKRLNNGYNRTQWQIIEALANGPLSLAQLFGANQNQEEVAFMGDLSFWCLVEQMRTIISIDTDECILHQDIEFYHLHQCQLTDKGLALL
mgnify:CR=1 FL=1